ncbi:C4-dicarboxylate ABC transporter substrate-binding protein [Pontibacillus chungwhensis BH030062]|uniref:C4-dicarboxylate ABC transporter substrate-binding protein n=1 Tax=Pontibacillus chungwhensis BH030062 TaxID=1385513 RepID=A0A0A2VA99_9BACI|nr:TRAP transporter substrate-binding protein DctP [Pontibacillus chungwhensis]KGP90635.1 C4-dicarboxylate ABC transporter substrate-binding protein [Pontibacillus chungwhensis BH030062]
MFKVKSLILLSMCIFMVGVIAGCNSEAEGNDKNESVTIKLGHIAPDEHSYTKGIEQFAEAVEEETNGQVKFEIFGGGQLGGEREVIEQVQLGTLDMTLVTAGPVGNFVDKFSVLEMPFIFRDVDHVYKTLDGEIGQELMGLIDEQGFKTLGIWENGFRHITTKETTVKSPEDTNGLKLRTIENEIYVDTYKSLGADATPIAFPEVYTSLQQGVVDGMDVSYGVMHATKMYEVQNNLSEVGIYYAAAPLLMNEAKFKSLPDNVQKVMIEKGKEFTDIQREINQQMEAEQKQDLQDKGIQIVEKQNVDIDAFKDAVKEVYKENDDRFGDLIERIRSVE